MVKFFKLDENIARGSTFHRKDFWDVNPLMTDSTNW